VASTRSIPRWVITTWLNPSISNRRPQRKLLRLRRMIWIAERQRTPRQPRSGPSKSHRPIFGRRPIVAIASRTRSETSSTCSGVVNRSRPRRAKQKNQKKSSFPVLLKPRSSLLDSEVNRKIICGLRQKRAVGKCPLVGAQFNLKNCCAFCVVWAANSVRLIPRRFAMNAAVSRTEAGSQCFMSFGAPVK
jgi:hypothetical protein